MEFLAKNVFDLLKNRKKSSFSTCMVSFIGEVAFNIDKEE
jgi:hypothetical protein